MIRSLDEMRTFKKLESRVLEALEGLPGEPMLTRALIGLRSRHQAHKEGHPYIPIGEGQRTDYLFYDVSSTGNEVYMFPTPIPLPDLTFGYPFNMILPEPEGT